MAICQSAGEVWWNSELAKKYKDMCVCLVREVGSGRRDELPVLPVFVSQSLITRALCASQRSHVTIFEQLQPIMACLLFPIHTH